MTDAPPLWRRLLHRWFVQYNPLYLVSAALVLIGTSLLSSALSDRSFLLAQLGIPAIAELYGWALVGGAALLTRIDLRRPAVMLALLAVLYQCDLTLHTETAVFLGGEGVVASAGWWSSFVAKLFALAWAMRLRISRSAWLIPSVGALGMAVVPHLLRGLSDHAASVLVGGWVFAMLAATAWTERAIEPSERLDGWGRTVLRRATRAVWCTWGTLMLAHVWFWCWDFGIPGHALLPAFAVLATRYVQRETRVWATSLATLVFVAATMPSLTAFTGLLVASALALRAWREPRVEVAPPATQVNPPYRTARAPSPEASSPRVVFGPASRAGRARLATGSVFALYLAVWTTGWTGGAWPAHVAALDGTLTVLVAAAWSFRVRLPAVGLATVLLHHGVVAGLITLPTTALTWGALAVGAGFVMLVALLALSYRSQRSLPAPERAPP